MRALDPVLVRSQPAGPWQWRSARFERRGPACLSATASSREKSARQIRCQVQTAMRVAVVPVGQKARQTSPAPLPTLQGRPEKTTSCHAAGRRGTRRNYPRRSATVDTSLRSSPTQDRSVRRSGVRQRCRKAPNSAGAYRRFFQQAVQRERKPELFRPRYSRAQRSAPDRA